MSRSPAKTLPSSFQHFTFRIADITCSVVSGDPSLRLRADGALQHFIVKGSDPDAAIEAGWTDLSVEKPWGRKIFDAGAVWQLYEQDDSYFLLFRSPVSGSSPYKMALMSREFSAGKVLLNRSCFDSEQPVNPLEYPLDELIIIHLLAMGKGIEIHACGLIDSSGRGYLFAGQSGAGKTTMARLWRDEPGVTILSDDRIVLRKKDDTIWMHGTPWHGDSNLASPEKVPLTAIYLLRHGAGNKLVRQGTADALSRLLACSFVPFYNPKGLDFTLGFLEEVTERIPCGELSFVPDRRVIRFLCDTEDS
jgi:hypothetical protein